jgi:hypothetical protein
LHISAPNNLQQIRCGSGKSVCGALDLGVDFVNTHRGEYKVTRISIVWPASSLARVLL